MSDEQTPRPAKDVPARPRAPKVTPEPDADPTVIVRGRVSHVEADGDQPTPLRVLPKQ
jgi:hypothetical protein